MKHKTVSNTENAEKNQQATATSISGKSREKKNEYKIESKLII